METDGSDTYFAKVRFLEDLFENKKKKQIKFWMCKPIYYGNEYITVIL